MNIFEIFLTSITALNANKARSILTMLGVIIGVTAVILLISIGRGVQNYITDQFDALGSNLLFVQPGKYDLSRDPAEGLTRNKLDEKHVDLIERNASQYVESVTPFIQTGGTASYKTKTFYASVYGLNERGNAIITFPLERGRYFTKSEVRAKTKVIVLGPSVAEELFGTQNPIDQRIKLADDSYIVIGVFEEKGQQYNQAVLIPYTAAADTFEIENFTNIVAKIKTADDVDAAMRQLQRVLMRDLDEDDFTILSQKDILSSIQEILAMLTLGLGAIAAISLVVGGIGIMNIMLVSVTERTREIGLRKALGATPNEIALQFLVESTLLSIGGGLIGIALGWLGSLAMQSFLRAEVPWWSILLAFSFSAFVGIIFGTYPAVQASRKDPIEALRYE